ncbi:cryptochrome/photolyase family protein [bacterium]|nr:cryptochrome/photolyase family protein [bacterium]
MADRTGGGEVRLILGDQLSGAHPWFAATDREVTYLMVEARGELTYAHHHRQKAAAFLAAMRAFAKGLERDGHRVRYLRADDPDNAGDLGAQLAATVDELDAASVAWLEPDEWRVDRALREAAAGLAVPWRVESTQHFVTGRGEVGDFFAGKKRWLQESFYRHLRRRHDVLMDGDEPAGGRWNFDADNRHPWDGAVPVPVPPRHDHDVRSILGMLDAQGVPMMGRDPEGGRLQVPVTRTDAERHLAWFLDEALPWFGRYEDAMSREHPTLFHSQLSFALNVKLLSPREVIDAVVARWQDDPGRYPLPAVEGFVRQVLGWREYVRGIYWAHMPDYATRNHLGHARPLPSWYWTGEVEAACLRACVGQSLDTAYAHHIQRLMVLGNFALLAGCDPDEVDAWYLGVYVDAVEWAQLPNTRGMSQFADGGLLATKPYVSAAAYIRRMSDHCQGCRYDPKQRTGPDACPFNSLYWDFHARHRETLASVPRIGQVWRTWERWDEATRAAIRARAAEVLDRIEEL